MTDTYTVSDRRARTGMAMALSEVSSALFMLQRKMLALRKEADEIEAFLKGQIDSSGKLKSRPEAPDRHTNSWYETVLKECEAAEKVQREAEEAARERGPAR